MLYTLEQFLGISYIKYNLSVYTKVIGKTKKRKTTTHKSVVTRDDCLGAIGYPGG